ncbi:MAG: cytochrome c biogenesis protein CcdA [Bacillota bacterium]
MSYLIAFLEGLITFVSPCLLPMLPVYLSYFAGGETKNAPRRTLTNAVGFVLGFSLVFLVLGLFAGALGGLLSKHKTIVNLVTGAIMVLFGLSFLGVFHLKIFRGGGRAFGQGFFSAMLFGMVFSISWTPCVGAFLGSALLLASQRGAALEGAAMLLTYSLGLGIPFILSAVLIDRLKNAFDFLKRHYKAVNAVSGGMLILMGILVMTGLIDRVFSLL